MMTYKGFIGTVTIDLDAKILFGRVANTRSVITFVSDTVSGLEKEFHDSVDFYIAVCEKQGIEPEKPVSGNIQLRTRPELQKAAMQAAAERGTTLTQYLNDLIEASVAKPSKPDVVAHKNRKSTATIRAPKSAKAHSSVAEAAVDPIVDRSGKFFDRDKTSQVRKTTQKKKAKG